MPRNKPPRSAAPKPKHQKRDLEKQYARFLKAAREEEVSDDPKALDKAVKRVTPRSTPK